LGLPDADQEYRVLVQRHVLERLYGRQGRLTGVHEDVVHDSLWESLRSPVLYRSEEGKDFLVEYRIEDHKFGYLVGQRLHDVVAIRTFLFLTMDGTPEGRALHRRLRLSRGDKAYLGLDDLGTFALTDVKNDAELVAILNDCGCGHLCKCTYTNDLVKHGYAQEMRRYLSLDLRRQ
jgi:hypothetical protein